MGIVLRQSLITSVISYIGVALGYVNLLFLYPKFLAPEQIGLLRTIQDAALLLAPLAQVGLAQSILRFYPQFARLKDGGDSFINLTLILSVLGYGLFILIFFIFKTPILSFFKENATEVLSYVDLILWLTLIIMVMTLYECFSRSLLKVAFPSFMREVALRLFQSILVSLYFLKYINFHQLLTLSVVVYLVSLLILVVYLVVYGQYRLKLRIEYFPKPKMWDILSFSLLNFIATSSAILIAKMDSLMVSGFKGFAANSIYTTAFYMATVIEIPKRAITQASSVLIARSFEEDNLQEVNRIYHKTSINQAIIAALLLLGIWANLANIFELVPNGDFYEAGMYVVIIVGAAKFIEVALGPSTETILLSKHHWFNLVSVGVLGFSGVILNYLLIPRFDVTGAAWATAIAIGLFNILKNVFIYVKLGIHPFSKAFVKVLMISAAVATVNLFLPKVDNVFLDIFYRSTIITVMFGGLVLITRCSEEINGLFTRVLRLLRIIK